MIKKIIFLIILLLIVIFNITVAYVDKNIEDKMSLDTYNSCHKIWSSRGLYSSHEEQNSITSMNKAFSSGAHGAEVDFYYDVKMDKFIVSHNRPKKDEEGNLIYAKKDGELLTLENFFKRLGENHYFWLDYKNLEKLDEDETSYAIKRLLEITNFNSLRERIYIEASNPLMLSKYTDAGFKTILGIHPPYESVFFSSVVISGYKIAYFFNNITALAMPYGKVDDPIYGESAQKQFSNIPLFLFHVPDNEKLLYSLISKKDVRVILAGRDKSINRFYVNNCN